VGPAGDAVDDVGARGSRERRRTEVPAAAEGGREGEERATGAGWRRLRRCGSRNRGRRRRPCGPALELGDGGASEVACGGGTGGAAGAGGDSGQGEAATGAGAMVVRTRQSAGVRQRRGERRPGSVEMGGALERGPAEGRRGVEWKRM
jgi:hypothetical protein